VIFPTLLLCIGAVALGLLCSRVVKSTTAALIVSCMVVMVLFVVNFAISFTNYRKGLFYYICLLSIFSAYHKCIFAIQLSYKRGFQEYVHLYYTVKKSSRFERLSNTRILENY
ncbi:unnamed protein product, partial [Cylicocyclus nassatus]